MRWTRRGTQTIKKLDLPPEFSMFSIQGEVAIKENIAGKLTHQGENEHEYTRNQNESLTYLSLAYFRFMVKFVIGEKVTNNLA